MDTELVNACESFSEGRIGPALERLADDVLWRIMGDRECDGIAELKAFCEQMTAHGCPDLSNQRTTVDERTVVVEGAENKPDGLLYCDCYTIDQGQIVEIRSYCASPSESIESLLQPTS